MQSFALILGSFEETETLPYFEVPDKTAVFKNLPLKLAPETNTLSTNESDFLGSIRDALVTKSIFEIPLYAVFFTKPP